MCQSNKDANAETGQAVTAHTSARIIDVLRRPSPEVCDWPDSHHPACKCKIMNAVYRDSLLNRL